MQFIKQPRLLHIYFSGYFIYIEWEKIEINLGKIYMFVERPIRRAIVIFTAMIVQTRHPLPPLNPVTATTHDYVRATAYNHELIWYD